MLLFDFDGTLAQSLELVYTIYNRIAPEYNLLQMDEEGRRVLAAGKPQDVMKQYHISPQNWLCLFCA